MVVNLISGTVSEKEGLEKILYVDDRVVVADSNEELQKTLPEWNNIRKHGIWTNIENIEETTQGKRLESCVVLVCVYGLGTLALTETGGEDTGRFG